jgi:hypothetical protein
METGTTLLGLGWCEGWNHSDKNPRHNRLALLCLWQNRSSLLRRWSLQRMFRLMVHNDTMMRFVCVFTFALLLALSSLPVALAQDTAPVEDEDDSSEQVEQKDDSYRRQMELEDARSRDRTYIDNTHSQKANLEKIDKLPEESRENIRDQLVDVIMENGEWEPKDALEEYPYAPTEAAQSDPELMEQEQEAWDEQIEKYHAREAAAFGTYRGPVPGPGNPTGQQGDGSQQGQQGGQQGSGQGGQDGTGDGESGDGSEGTYQPYQSGSNGSEDEVSTAGVSESALDFLRGGQGRQQPPPQGSQPQPPQAQPQSPQAQEQATGVQQAQAEEQAPEEGSEQAQTDQAAEQSAAQNAEQAQAEQQQESPQDIQLDTRGIIAIKDLDKLEGTELPGEQEDSEDP